MNLGPPKKTDMHIGRRTLIQAGIGFGATMLFPARGLFAQVQPLIQKKIPSSGESIPIIGIGTARGGDVVGGAAGSGRQAGPAAWAGVERRVNGRGGSWRASGRTR